MPIRLLIAVLFLAVSGLPARTEEPPTVPSPKKDPPVSHTKPDPKQPPKFTNRLAQETSPYLLQHKHNPVDWYPWGPEAFEKARKENKPIFLSVGYSACHW